jgi:hypothetical protein
MKGLGSSNFAFVKPAATSLTSRKAAHAPQKADHKGPATQFFIKDQGKTSSRVQSFAGSTTGKRKMQAREEDRVEDGVARGKSIST